MGLPHTDMGSPEGHDGPVHPCRSIPRQSPGVCGQELWEDKGSISGLWGHRGAFHTGCPQHALSCAASVSVQGGVQSPGSPWASFLPRGAAMLPVGLPAEEQVLPPCAALHLTPPQDQDGHGWLPKREFKLDAGSGWKVPRALGGAVVTQGHCRAMSLFPGDLGQVGRRMPLLGNPRRCPQPTPCTSEHS